MSHGLNLPKPGLKRRLKFWNIWYNFKWNQPYLSRGLNLNRRSNSATIIVNWMQKAKVKLLIVVFLEFKVVFIVLSFVGNPVSPTILTAKKQTTFWKCRDYGAGEGRRPWATTISPSVPPHLTLPVKTTFLNGIFRAFKAWF